MNAIAPGTPIPNRRTLAVSLLAFLLCGSGTGADAASNAAPTSLAAAAADFGSPPSGEIPILYNDHTVYATPDILKQSRVLAALVKDGQIYVPLRSMFEQMGASVSASADGQTITAVKGDVNVSVTVGKPELLINGESRPLDVPPMVYKGIVLVPVRVLSEALGAYVQWVPDRHVVVVRYIPPMPPPPTAAPTEPPTAAPPTPVPTVVPAATPYPAFIEGAALWATNYNEFTAGGDCPQYTLSAAYTFRNSPFSVKLDYRQDAYLTSDNLTNRLGNQYTRFSTIDGGTALVPVFLGYQSTFDARLEYQVVAPRFNVGVSYLQASNNYGYPQLNAFGVGVEKLPDLAPGVSPYGSVFYYPSASGNYTVPAAGPNAGKSYRLQYQIVKYDIGLALVLKRFPVYLYGGFSADQYGAKQNAPIGQTHAGPYVGLGVKL